MYNKIKWNKLANWYNYNYDTLCWFRSKTHPRRKVSCRAASFYRMKNFTHSVRKIIVHLPQLKPLNVQICFCVCAATCRRNIIKYQIFFSVFDVQVTMLRENFLQ